MRRTGSKLVFVRYEGTLYTYAALAEKLGISIKTLRERAYRKGWERVSRARRLVRVKPGENGLEKECVMCLQWLSLDSCFSKSKFGAWGRDNRCKACVVEKYGERGHRRSDQGRDSQSGQSPKVA